MHGVEQRQHAVTSRPMMSKYDPWVNMLRTTVAAFAATVGGADAVTVQPFDRPLGRPDAFGRRIARNQMALLLDESHVGTVTDPAGGAWAVERLTHDLAVAGWEFLQALEGGASLDDAGRRHRRRARPPGRHPPPPAHRPHRVPEPRRDAARARRRARRRTPLRRRLRGPARRAGRRRRSSWPRWARSPLTPRGRRSRPTCSPPAASPSSAPARPTTPTACSRRTPGSRSSAWPVPTRRTTSGAPTWSPASATAGARHVIVAGQAAASSTSTTPARSGVDALAFLRRTREALA